MAFGVVTEGFSAKDLEVLLEEIEQAERSVLGSAINTQADSVLGQVNGVIGDKLAELWEVALAIYRARQPDSASGEALDNVAAITGALRLPATPSTALLSLNLDPAVTLPIGTIVGIGASGAQWETQAELTNAGADQATLQVTVDSSDSAPIVGNAYAIDTIVTPIGGWAAKAAFNSLTSEPFALIDLQTLLIEVDEGPTQTVTFNTGDFADISNATAQEVIDAITADTSGIDGLDVGGFLRLFSELDGSGSAIRVTGGTGFEALGLSQELIKGFNPSRSAKIVNATNELYDMSGSPTLFVAIDGGSSQTITFLPGDFVAPATATAIEVATKINAVLVGGVAYEVAGKVQIESLVVGNNSLVEVTGGSANTELGYTLSVPQGGVSGDATLGRDVESDPDFRVRRLGLLRISGAATLEAIRSAILNTDNVLQAFVFENPTDFVDGFGRPPHSFEAVVSGGTDVAVAQTIFDTKPIGIQTFAVVGPNGVTEVITDSQGTGHSINFSRADSITMHVELDIDVVAVDFGAGNQVAGEQQVREAIKALGDLQQIGQKVTILAFQCVPLAIAGVSDVTAIFIEDVDPPLNTANIILLPREIATFSIADIDINVNFV